MIALDVLHVICSRLCLGHLSVRVGEVRGAVRRLLKKSVIVPLNAIIIIIIIIVINIIIRSFYVQVLFFV